jgi:hypothetical protein
MATDGWKNFQNIVEMQAEMNPIDSETTVKTDQLNGQDLSDNVVGDVYYNVGNDGYDATDQSIVISETTNMGICDYRTLFSEHADLVQQRGGLQGITGDARKDTEHPLEDD